MLSLKLKIKSVKVVGLEASLGKTGVEKGSFGNTILEATHAIRQMITIILSIMVIILFYSLLLNDYIYLKFVLSFLVRKFLFIIVKAL